MRGNARNPTPLAVQCARPDHRVRHEDHVVVAPHEPQIAAIAVGDLRPHKVRMPPHVLSQPHAEDFDELVGTQGGSRAIQPSKSRVVCRPQRPRVIHVDLRLGEPP